MKLQSRILQRPIPLPPLQHRHLLLLLRRRRRQQRQQQLRSLGKGRRRHTTRVTIWTVRSYTLRNLERQIRSHNGRSQSDSSYPHQFWTVRITPRETKRTLAQENPQIRYILQSKIIKICFGFGYWYFFKKKKEKKLHLLP